MQDKILNTAIILIMGLAGYGFTIYLNDANPPESKTTTISQKSGNRTIVTLKDQKTPDFSFTDIKNISHSISNFKEKIIILNFWATWCAPCIKEFPQLLEIAHSDPENIVLIALSSDMNEDAIKKFLNKLKKQKGITWQSPNVLIALDKNQHITQKLFQTYRLPETYIIDKQQNLHTKIIGANWKKPEIYKIIESIKHSS